MSKPVTLCQMVEAMSSYKDTEVFRWYQTSYVGRDGSTHPDVTMYVTMGQIRKLVKWMEESGVDA